MIEAVNEGPRSLGTDRVRSVAQLNMLHSLAAKLNRLGDVEEIGVAITDELRTIIDYHNCRVYVVQPDGRTLFPVAFSGDISVDYGEETIENLTSQIGEGITGRVAESRTSLLTPDARDVDFSVQIPGTDDVLESILAVPMVVGPDVAGVIVLSSLGYGQFDEDDQRLLEVLASHAAIAIENASLFQAEREAAETSAALLRLSQALTTIRSTDDILREAMDTIPTLVACSALAVYLRDEETGAFRRAHAEVLDGGLALSSESQDVAPDIAVEFLLSMTEPFRLPRELVATVPAEYRMFGEVREVLVAPLRWEPDGFGAIVLIAKDEETEFEERDLRLSRGVADITSLALGTERKMSELERFHALVESLDAVFWEADAGSFAFTFLSAKAADLFGRDVENWIVEGRTWGDHIFEEDRMTALEVRADVGDGQAGANLEYRVVTAEGRTAWIRDMVSAVRSAGVIEGYRGLMVDITQRKRAEQALRKSERKYSEAFKREREAAQRLRALDEMKNTFLEAVSHDLRTPLTSILGSALTLEQSELHLPREDALDLVGRIAANARKLERLLSDLLDLDRLQRGIMTPQRRATDVQALITRCVEELEHEDDRLIEVDVADLTAMVDSAKLERIVENLLSNAIRHTPRTAAVWVRAWEADHGLYVAVEDSGPGLADDMREAVFEPFQQVPGSASMHSPGVGVGLTLVRRFAELHGGRAWLEPRDGGGASFRVFLPDD